MTEVCSNSEMHKRVSEIGWPSVKQFNIKDNLKRGIMKSLSCWNQKSTKCGWLVNMIRILIWLTFVFGSTFPILKNTYKNSGVAGIGLNNNPTD